MNFECVDVSNWYKQLELTKGSRNKVWLIKPFPVYVSPDSDIEIFLFKESHRRHPNEFWSEVITDKIGNLVNIPTPETSCARMDDKYGALIRFFLKVQGNKIIESLDHGGDLILANHPTFDRTKGETHNIYYVQEIFEAKNRNDLFEDFLRILVFDALIGNTDRHQDNWGFILNDRRISSITPAFDNSDSLGREIVEEKILGFLESNNQRLMKYVLGGKPHIRWSDDGGKLEWVNHFELLKRLAVKWPNVVNYIKIQTAFTDSQIDDILNSLGSIKIETEQYVLTPRRLQLIKKIICLRRDILREQFRI